MAIRAEREGLNPAPPSRSTCARKADEADRTQKPPLMPNDGGVLMADARYARAARRLLNWPPEHDWAVALERRRDVRHHHWFAQDASLGEVVSFDGEVGVSDTLTTVTRTES
jgi:hypothetical protein